MTVPDNETRSESTTFWFILITASKVPPGAASHAHPRTRYIYTLPQTHHFTVTAMPPKLNLTLEQRAERDRELGNARVRKCRRNKLKGRKFSCQYFKDNFENAGYGVQTQKLKIDDNDFLMKILDPLIEAGVGQQISGGRISLSFSDIEKNSRYNLTSGRLINGSIAKKWRVFKQQWASAKQQIARAKDRRERAPSDSKDSDTDSGTDTNTDADADTAINKRYFKDEVFLCSGWTTPQSVNTQQVPHVDSSVGDQVFAVLTDNASPTLVYKGPGCSAEFACSMVGKSKMILKEQTPIIRECHAAPKSPTSRPPPLPQRRSNPAQNSFCRLAVSKATCIRSRTSP